LRIVSQYGAERIEAHQGFAGAYQFVEQALRALNISWAALEGAGLQRNTDPV
jgi:hypothetical protein